MSTEHHYMRPHVQDISILSYWEHQLLSAEIAVDVARKRLAELSLTDQLTLDFNLDLTSTMDVQLAIVPDSEHILSTLDGYSASV